MDLSLPLVLLSASACASVDPRPDYEAARADIRATTGASEVHDPEGPVMTSAELAAVLDDGLSLAEATRLALLENRRLQAGFLALGVGRADYVQAGLLENPSLSLAFLFPDSGGRVRWAADLLGSVTDLWRIPARQELAETGVQQRILELSRFAGELVAGTRAAYHEGVAARALRALEETNVELARRSLAGVRRQVEEGVTSRVEEGLAESLALGAELAFQRAQREESAALRRLAAYLSLEQDLLTVPLTDALPAPEAPAWTREDLVARSLVARADLRAAGRVIAAAEARVVVERKQRFGLDAGVSAERPEGGSEADLLLGPAATLELPVFDQNQARIGRAEYELAELQKEREALLAEVRQEVRAALDRAEVAARAALFARDRLVPQAGQSARLAETAHALGDTTLLTWLAAQRVANEARRTEIEALLEAALARVDLERAVGAPLAALPPR